MRWAVRMWKVIREMAWIVGFMVLVLPAITRSKLFGQDPDKHSIRSSVRPNDSTKVDPFMPWVSEYEAPAFYDKWWKEIAECEHLPYPGQLTKQIRWVEVNSHTFRLGRHIEYVYGFTDASALTIYIARDRITDWEIVKHEMVHQIHWWMGFDEGEDYHPPDYFENCNLHTTHP